MNTDKVKFSLVVLGSIIGLLAGLFLANDPTPLGIFIDVILGAAVGGIVFNIATSV